jgi:Ca2+-binding RTX toxin-like protein
MSNLSGGITYFSGDDGAILTDSWSYGDSFFEEYWTYDGRDGQYVWVYGTYQSDGVVLEDIYVMDDYYYNLLDWSNANVYVSYDDLTYGGADWVFSGFKGRDVIVGNGYADILKGGDGADKLSGMRGNDMLYGEAGSDKLYGASGHDRLFGSTGHDTLYGGTGNDRLSGNQGNDRLYGSDGNDRLNGSVGNDLLSGGRGIDHMTGGDGFDTFVFSSAVESGRSALRDTIADFVRGVDLIDLSGMDANISASGNQKFTFIGRAGFHEVAGELRFNKEVLSGDIDGDGARDFEVLVTDVSRLTADDILL